MLIFKIWLVVQMLSPLLCANFFNFGPNLPSFKIWRQNFAWNLCIVQVYDVKQLIYIPTEYYMILNLINYTKRGIWGGKKGYEEVRLNIVEKEGGIQRQRGAIWRCHCRSRSTSFRDQCKCAGMIFLTLISIQGDIRFAFKEAKYRKYNKKSRFDE